MLLFKNGEAIQIKTSRCFSLHQVMIALHNYSDISELKSLNGNVCERHIHQHLAGGIEVFATS